jgi:hypothetical protein
VKLKLGRGHELAVGGWLAVLLLLYFATLNATESLICSDMGQIRALKFSVHGHVHVVDAEQPNRGSYSSSS